MDDDIQEGEGTAAEESEEGFYDDEFRELEQEWIALNAERDNLRGELERVNGELAGLRSELESVRAAGGAASTQEEAVHPETATIIISEPESSHFLYKRLWNR